MAGSTGGRCWCVGQNRHRWGRGAQGWGRAEGVHMYVGACPIHPAAGRAAYRRLCGLSKDP